jgi:catalase
MNRPFALLGLAAGLLSPLQAQEPLTRDNGAPVGDNQNSKTAGERGGVLLEDVQLIQKLQRFDRERIPERVVHARGTAAHGVFTAAADLSDLTIAQLFGAAGRETPVFVRFSSVIHPSGSPETLRDPRGFAVKFYTAEGNWDLVGNNLPVFFIRDAIKFPDMVHSLKPSPLTNRQDPNRFFDFFSHVPESTHMLTQLYSDLGTPQSYAVMDGNGVHAYKFVDAEGGVTYVKFHWKSLQPFAAWTRQEAGAVQATDFQPHTTDLYARINSGNFPRWELCAQYLKPDQLDAFSFDPLDATKIWPVEEVPEHKIGEMVLNRMPANFFQETEQSAFAPANLVPGIEPSEDRLLQGRVFSYADTQLHRLGPNHMSLPINRPLAPVNNGNQDGFADHGATASDVNYQPSREGGFTETPAARLSSAPLAGATQQRRIAKPDNFTQAGNFYRALDAAARERLIGNIAADLSGVRSAEIREIIVGFFFQADADYGARIAKAVGVELAAVRARIAGMQ